MMKPGLGKVGKQFRILFNLGFAILLFIFLSDRKSLVKYPLYLGGDSSKTSFRWSLQRVESSSGPKASDKLIFNRENLVSNIDHRSSRILIQNPSEPRFNLSVILAESPSDKRQHSVTESPSETGLVVPSGLETVQSSSLCAGLKEHTGYRSQCEFIKVHKQCTSGGFFEYISFFYYTCEKWSIFGYVILALWLVALFYMLGNTAADYFCCSLENLSMLLKLPPTVAGVTLLPLGNGAPDVFASIAAFMGADAGEVGLNSVLGGAVFITTVVAGLVALFIAGSRAQIDRRCFIRDVCFFLLTVASLCLILFIGKVNLWGAMAFISIYVLYAFTLAANEFLKKQTRKLKWDSMTPMHSFPGSTFPLGAEDEDDSMYSPLLDLESTTGLAAGHGRLETSLPQWIWASNVAIFSNQGLAKTVEEARPLWGWSEDSENYQSRCSLYGFLLCLVEWPLTLPRQLTIPIVEDDRWSKGVAVASAILAPILLALLWNMQETKPLGIGKVKSNVALALNGGDGVQIAMSGCYAGPMFNTLVGLGIPLLMGSWSKRPAAYIVPKDTRLFYTLGFLITGLLWALVVFPMNDMPPRQVVRNWPFNSIFNIPFSQIEQCFWASLNFRVAMKNLPGMPGTASGLVLRIGQFLFAATAIAVTVTGIFFSSYTAFCFMIELLAKVIATFCSAIDSKSFQVYLTWRYVEKDDGIRSLQKNSKDPATKFYNILF